MGELHPEIEPYEAGVLDVGAGNLLHWETCGNASGKPALVVHGGPGSGCAPFFRRLFDPNAYRIVLFDQRNCGRSRPRAADPDVELSSNNTGALVEDMERLRERLRIERWLVLGGSWGSTLSLAYAERHPGRVSEMVLFGVTTGRRSEVDWSFRGGLAIVFPAQWQRLADYAGGNDVIDTFARLLADRDEKVRRDAAREWCLWESATMAWPPTNKLAARFEDPDYAVAFARIVNHYVRHDLFLEDGVLLRNADSLSDIPGALINARWDLQAPIGNAWELSRVWPRAKLVVVDEGGHGAGAGVSREIVSATDRFARRYGG